MCGFTGIYAFNEIGRFFTINLAKSNETLKHRGPDDAYLFTDHHVGLGHRRLAILDLSTDGRQPMTDPSGRYTLVYNGEIYNFRTLREELVSAGYTFCSQSDTEVLLTLFAHYGANCLEKLNGFFAFAVYDKQENSLFIARDRYGIKPLWYYHDEDKFLFASELNALLAFNLEKKLNHTALYQFFHLNYVPAPHSLLQNVHKLLPGHYLTVNKKGIETQRYYQLPTTSFSPMPSYEAAQRTFGELLEASVQRRLIADVPLGAFLSGGIDSSTIVALAARHVPHLHTFSVGYRDAPFFDETHYAQLVAKQYQTEHTVFQLTNDDFYEHLDDILQHFAEPFADASAIPTYILSQKTCKHVTVALSGDGGDELLAGYQRYTGEWYARQNGWRTTLLTSLRPLLQKLPQHRNAKIPNKIRQLRKFAEIASLSAPERYWQLCSWRDDNHIRQMLTDETYQHLQASAFASWKATHLKAITGESMNEVLRADFDLLLPNDMLHKTDSMSMANGLEVRVPFLDHPVVDYAFQLTADYKISGNFKKKLLQDFARPLLPKALYRRPKQGFDVPLATAYATVWKKWLDSTLFADEYIAEQGIFNPAYIRQLKQTLFSKQPHDQNQVWGLVCFQYWWQKFMDER